MTWINVFTAGWITVLQRARHRSMAACRRWILLPAVLSVVASVPAGAIDFGFDSDNGQSLVRVTTTCPLMVMEHWTTSITGKATLDPEDVRNSTSAYFTVQTADMSSHRDLWKVRDKLVHTEYLQVSRYPVAEFTLTSINKSSSSTLGNFKPVEVTAEGDFTLHGVTRPVTVHAVVIYMMESAATQARGEGSLLSIRADWTFKLSDFNIKIPQKGPVLFDDEQKMLLRVIGSTVKK